MSYVQMIGAAFVGLFEGQASRVIANRNNDINSVNVNAQYHVREASNSLEAAKNNLARWVQSVNNNRMLDAGGQQLEAARINYRRERDAVSREDIGSSLQRAEQAGSAAARQAFSGTGGNVADMVNASTSIRNSFVAEALKDRSQQMDFDAVKRAGAIASSMVGGLDNSIILDSFDLNKSYTTVQPVFNTMQNVVRGIGSSMGAVNQTQAATGTAPTGAPTAGVGEGIKTRASFTYGSGNGLGLSSEKGKDSYWGSVTLG
jgi:hypothetical protein